MRIRRVLSLRRDLVIALAVPIVVKVGSLAAAEIRARNADGESRAADRIDKAGQMLRRVQRFV